jgi:uncharacterized membrane protein
MTFEQVMEGIVLLFELTGVAVLVVGSLTVVVRAAQGYLAGQRGAVYEAARQGIGRAILLGLEILIIADIIQTIIVDPTLESAATLGVIVLVRIILSFSLDIELTGRLPWRIADAATRDASGPPTPPSFS